jgi:hypothetical protein
MLSVGNRRIYQQEAKWCCLRGMRSRAVELELHCLIGPDILSQLGVSRSWTEGTDGRTVYSIPLQVLFIIVIV